MSPGGETDKLLVSGAATLGAKNEQGPTTTWHRAGAESGAGQELSAPKCASDDQVNTTMGLHPDLTRGTATLSTRSEQVLTTTLQPAGEESGAGLHYKSTEGTITTPTWQLRNEVEERAATVGAGGTTGSEVGAPGSGESLGVQGYFGQPTLIGPRTPKTPRTPIPKPIPNQVLNQNLRQSPIRNLGRTKFQGGTQVC